MRWPVVMLTVVGLALGLAACGEGGDVVDVGAAPSRLDNGATTPSPGGVGSAPPTDAGTAAGGAADRSSNDAGGPVEDVAPDPPGGTGDERTDATTTVLVYLTRGEQVTARPRSVERVVRIGGATLGALLAGPTAEERVDGLGTAIPETTRLRNLSIVDGVAIVDLSADFEAGGGTLGLTLRLAQVVCTLDQFPTVDGVRFALDGTIVDVFSGDGIIVDEPVACSDYAALVAD